MPFCYLSSTIYCIHHDFILVLYWVLVLYCILLYISIVDSDSGSGRRWRAEQQQWWVFRLSCFVLRVGRTGGRSLRLDGTGAAIRQGVFPSTHCRRPRPLYRTGSGRRWRAEQQQWWVFRLSCFVLRLARTGGRRRWRSATREEAFSVYIHCAFQPAGPSAFQPAGPSAFQPAGPGDSDHQSQSAGLRIISLQHFGSKTGAGQKRKA